MRNETEIRKRMEIAWKRENEAAEELNLIVEGKEDGDLNSAINIANSHQRVRQLLQWVLGDI